jgi:cephalosporin hydroxylase
MVKSPFDLALYSLLLWKLAPRTIFEIGSFKGGSALWFADMLEAMEIDGQVLSYDTHAMHRPEHERVTFRYADGRHLGRHIRSELLNAAPHPWLVVEDADHEFDTSISVLRFFEPHMHSGDWFVVEDANLTQMYPEHGTSGPHRALGVFLSQHPDEYRIGSEIADFFAYNATTATNGWLEKR